LKEQRSVLEKQIQQDLSEKNKIEKEIAVLTEKLTRINGKIYLESLSKKMIARNDYDKAIQETEGAYIKILESSQTLLHVLKRESLNLAKKVNL
jgi:sjoegren syndrome nuclear autoantigen 1